MRTVAPSSAAASCVYGTVGDKADGSRGSLDGEWVSFGLQDERSLPHDRRRDIGEEGFVGLAGLVNYHATVGRVLSCVVEGPNDALAKVRNIHGAALHLMTCG